MRQKGMAMFLAMLLAAGTAAPAYAAEEVFSFEMVYVGEAREDNLKSSGQRDIIPPQTVVMVESQDQPKDAATFLPEQPADSGFPYTLGSFGEEVLRLTNEARAAAGSPPLEADPTLTEMAQARMEENWGRLTHTRPDGTTPDTIFGEYDTDLICTGEIIMSSSRSPQAIVNGFLASPSHRENLLNPDHRYVGIGTSWGETPAGTGIAVLELFAK